ncbi:MAG: ubiquitin-like domain-containing protein [Thermacetogeniaceae bacterium]|nr:ubiquitin-like domain-containing protein [Thermoanaerobacterales bacterium]NLN20454.1 DUF348 domain-containing protein [Syntrophomonadaceae bacterium]
MSDEQSRGQRFSGKKLVLGIVIVITLIGILSWGAVVYATDEIRISVDGKELRHETLKGTVEEALTEAGIEVKPHDQVTPGLKSEIKDGMLVVVERAFPVQLVADGDTTTIYTTTTNVRGVLKKASLSLGELDRVSPELDAEVEPGCEIRVTRVKEEVITEEYDIPAKTERKPDSTLNKGQQKVVREGSPGEGVRQVKVVYEDGKEVSRKTIKDQVVRSPVNRVIAYGTISTISRGGDVIRYRKVIQARATAYGPSAGKYTATGHRVARGVVAVDPRVIPLGSRLYIDGYGYGRALDVGGAIKGNTVDLFFPSDAECYRWGVRYVKVYILQ